MPGFTRSQVAPVHGQHDRILHLVCRVLPRKRQVWSYLVEESMVAEVGVEPTRRVNFARF